MKTASIQHLISHKHVLLLQGKMGNFFHRFATFLHSFDIKVSKINFNAGDKFFYNHDNSFDYTGKIENFSDWLTKFMRQRDIDAVVCFGDCRPYHYKTSLLCQKFNISFFVFEEGYLRPDYITFEEGGINGFSKLDITKLPPLSVASDQPIFTHNRFYKLCLSTIIYYLVVHFRKKNFPHYTHYRGMSAWKEAKAWLKAPIRKLAYYIPDKIRLPKHLVNNLDKKYFVVCLQVHNDSQITHHSNYNDVHEFIDEVVDSFAKYSNKKHSLVIKHHPLDRGHRDYRKYIKKLAKKYNIENRIYYGVDMHLPTVIKHSLGMVVVNSTTGLQSIYHKKPTKVMGRAIYNFDKLTDQQPLNSFWINPQKPDRDFYLRFREYLIEQNQLNGSFYGTSPWMNEFAIENSSKPKIQDTFTENG